ncbi:unnamed protein product [Closterium sp. NIES-54]
MTAAKRVLRYLCSTSGLGLVLGGRRPVVLTGHADASWADDQATQRSSKGYTFSLGSGSVSWRSTRSSSVLGSSCEAEIYAGAMAAQELHWLTYLLTDLGEQPRSPPVLYVDNKAMLALCREHRLEHRTKHIALRYFLACELQQRGQLRLAYVASQANTADIFTKALPPGDHQRFYCVVFLLRSGSSGGQRQQQQRSPETPSPQQLREWYAGRQRGGGAGPCTYVLRTGDRTGEQCGGLHSTQRCFGRLTDAWRHQFPDATEIPRWGDLSRAGVAIFDLDYDAILAAMYALSTSDEGDCYLCVPPDPGIEAAALGAGETAALGASASAAPGADRTTLTPLSRPVAVSLADPSGGPVLASFSTVLPCPAAPSGSLSGLYLPSFSTNLVSGADLQDQGVDQFTPASQRVTHCTCARTGRHLATFTRRPGSSLYTLSTESPPLSASGQVAASSQVLAAASGSGPEHGLPCPRLWSPPVPPPPSSGPCPNLRPLRRGAAARCPSLLRVSSDRGSTADFSHGRVGPARVRGQGHERYFLLVVDDYSRYTTVFPLRSKGEVTEVLIDYRCLRPTRVCSQRQGVDYFQTFSPTPKMTTLRVLLHVAAQRDYELHSLDFSTAFLQGSLHEEIWLRRPPGFTGSFPPGTQWSLRRPVYGLCQAPREWHDTMRTTLAALGFAPSTADPSLFLHTDTSLPPFYVLVYVDDLVFATADTAGLAHVKSELQKRHTCTDLGELRSYLGLQITRDRAQRTITLTQSHMVQQVLQRFDFTYSSPQATPLSTCHSLSALPSDESVEPSGPYPELVGCLMYLMTCTRPDLAYPLSILARYVAPRRH